MNNFFVAAVGLVFVVVCILATRCIYRLRYLKRLHQKHLRVVQDTYEKFLRLANEHEITGSVDPEFAHLVEELATSVEGLVADPLYKENAQELKSAVAVMRALLKPQPPPSHMRH